MSFLVPERTGSPLTVLLEAKNYSRRPKCGYSDWQQVDARANRLESGTFSPSGSIMKQLVNHRRPPRRRALLRLSAGP